MLRAARLRVAVGVDRLHVYPADTPERFAPLDTPPAPPAPGSPGRRALRLLLTNPVTRVIVGFVAVGVFASAAQNLLRPLRPVRDQPLTPGAVALNGLAALLAGVAVLAAYALFVRLYERRWPRELRPAGVWTWLPLGFAVGAGLVSVSALVLRWGGWAVVERVAPPGEWGTLAALALGSQFAVACIEEVLIRGVLFRIAEDSLGSWWALGLSAALFGLMHLGNENATWAAALGLSLQAGVLLGAAYMASRSLWLPIGIHWAWNGIQAGVFGGALSGNAVRAIVTARPAGPDYLSGGPFGLEGSVLTTLWCALVGVGFCVLSVRLNRVRPGFRARPKGD